MSKRVKSLIEGELKKQLGDLENIAVISPRGIDGAKNYGIRLRLHAKGLRMKVVKNTLARRATKDSKIAGFAKLLDGPSAVIYGQGSFPNIAKLLLEEKKTNEKLELRGAYFDGEVYEGEKGLEAASKMPTREEAIAAIVGAILGPGKKLAGALKGPGGKLGGVLKAIEEKAGKEAPVATATEVAPATATAPATPAPAATPPPPTEAGPA